MVPKISICSGTPVTNYNHHDFGYVQLREYLQAIRYKEVVYPTKDPKFVRRSEGKKFLFARNLFSCFKNFTENKEQQPITNLLKYITQKTRQ